MVVLSAKEYEEIMEELDMIEDVRLYDEAKKEDDGEGYQWKKRLR